jgi:hypothetical protein
MLLLAIAFGFFVGRIPALVMRKANVRNASAIVAVSMGIAALGYYLSWVIWIYAVISKYRRSASLLRFIQRPQVIWHWILRFNEVGTRTLGSGSSATPISGIALWIIWALEALCIFGGAWAAVKELARNIPFCERCQKWCSGLRGFARTKPSEPGDLKTRLEAGDMDFMPALPIFSGDLGRYFQWSYNQCPQCKTFNTLTVADVTATRNKKGKISRVKKNLIRQLILDAGQLQRLMPPQIAAAVATGAPPPMLLPAALPATVANPPPIPAAASKPPAPLAPPAPPISAPVQAPSPAPRPAGGDQLLDL